MVSTFGKVIKKGWEWIGIVPKRYAELVGLIEIPGLAEILTTNKSDFLNDAASLKKYYRYRKAVQEAVLATLAQMGEADEQKISPSRELASLSREIESAIGHLVPDFPELETLVGTRRITGFSPAALSDTADAKTVERAERITTIQDELQNPLVSTPSKNEEDHNVDTPLVTLKESSDGRLLKKTQKKIPGLKLSFEEFIEDAAVLSLGRMIEDTVLINTAHPAWKKATEEKMGEYHVLLTVACVLSQFLDEHHAPHDFISRFLASWGQPFQQPLL